MRKKIKSLLSISPAPLDTLISPQPLEHFRKKIIELSSKGFSPEEIFTDICYVDGALDEEILSLLRLHKKSFDLIVGEYKHLSYAWWLAQGRMFLTSASVSEPRINFNVWHAYMKNRFGWADNKNDDKTTSVEVNVKQINIITAKAVEDAMERYKSISIKETHG